MNLGLEGKRAVVTAASKGLGKSAASALATEGADIAICSRSKAIFSTLEELQGTSSSRVFASQADLSIAADIERFIAGAAKDLGGIDILIINAGGPPPGGFLDLTPEDWQDAVQLTLMSAVRLCYAVLPLMVDQGSGSIVAIESYSVKQPIHNLILSNSLRLGVIGLMKSLANEFGPKGIRVNTINPAWTWTARVEQLMADRAERENTTLDEQTGRVTSEVPLGRMGTVEEFGRTIAWLASPAASFVHGHALMFDGGSVKVPL
jgi:3-oxoacyl-[acyl-carrier protein] reductase